MKYNPGFKYQYISRYCQVSKVAFKYYKNELMSLKHIFPLFDVSLCDIDRVERIAIDLPV